MAAFIKDLQDELSPPGLANRPISQLAELTPAAWANRNAGKSQAATGADQDSDPDCSW